MAEESDNPAKEPQSENERRAYLASQYVDGAMTPENRTSFERDLAKDLQLQQLVADFRNVDTQAAVWIQDVPEPDWPRFEQSLTARVSAERSRPHGHGWIIRLGAPLAAAAAIVLVATIFLQREASLAPTPTSAVVPEVSVALVRPNIASDSYVDAYVSFSHKVPVRNYQAKTGESPAGLMIAQVSIGGATATSYGSRWR